MKKHCTPLLFLLACACASGAPGATSTRSTTSISMPSTGSPGANAGTVEITTHTMLAAARVNVAAPVERVWEVLPQAMQEVGIEVGHFDPANHQIGNRRLVLSRKLGQRPLSELVSCGRTAFGAPVADSYRVELSVLSSVVPAAEGGGSVLRTEVSGVASNIGSTPVACATSGVLEQDIARAVQLRLAEQP